MLDTSSEHGFCSDSESDKRRSSDGSRKTSILPKLRVIKVGFAENVLSSPKLITCETSNNVDDDRVCERSASKNNTPSAQEVPRIRSKDISPLKKKKSASKNRKVNSEFAHLLIKRGMFKGRIDDRQLRCFYTSTKHGKCVKPDCYCKHMCIVGSPLKNQLFNNEDDNDSTKVEKENDSVVVDSEDASKLKTEHLFSRMRQKLGSGELKVNYEYEHYIFEHFYLKPRKTHHLNHSSRKGKRIQENVPEDPTIPRKRDDDKQNKIYLKGFKHVDRKLIKPVKT